MTVIMRPLLHVHIPAGSFTIEGDLHTTRDSTGLVVFVHGSGITRAHPSNDAVARHLEEAGFATLLLDLLQDYETQHCGNVFDVAMQADRLLAVRGWLNAEARMHSLPVGLFGSGIGAGVVLTAAAKAPQGVSAVVCRGGRPDTGLYYVPQVSAPTLFIDDDRDAGWVEMAYRQSRADKHLVHVCSASHAYKEAAAIAAVADHAQHWFNRYLTQAQTLTAAHGAPGVPPKVDAGQISRGGAVCRWHSTSRS
jgi:putative phosphoribosyl transferase